MVLLCKHTFKNKVSKRGSSNSIKVNMSQYFVVEQERQKKEMDKLMTIFIVLIAIGPQTDSPTPKLVPFQEINRGITCLFLFLHIKWFI